MNISPRYSLLRSIDKISFAINDATLYLDTHPCDTTALSFIEENIKLRNEALAKYAMSYGPLLVDNFTNTNSHWTWINAPMPWEGGIF